MVSSAGRGLAEHGVELEQNHGSQNQHAHQHHQHAGHQAIARQHTRDQDRHGEHEHLPLVTRLAQVEQLDDQQERDKDRERVDAYPDPQHLDPGDHDDPEQDGVDHDAGRGLIGADREEPRDQDAHAGEDQETEVLIRRTERKDRADARLEHGSTKGLVHTAPGPGML